jgi:6-phosphogluconolactonase
MDVTVYPTQDDVAAAVADLIASEVSAGAATIGLAGGSTPTAAYRLLPERDLDWSRVTLWLGDERWVPVDHPDSNTGMAKAIFADTVAASIILPRTDLDHPAAAAAAYEAELFAALDGTAPRLVLLGMGDDGHTASLFPRTDALELPRTGYVANWVPEQETWRLTATMPLLWSAQRLVFVVTGESKAAMLAKILDRKLEYPAQRVAAGARDVSWLLDEAAASELTSVPR